MKNDRWKIEENLFFVTNRFWKTGIKKFAQSLVLKNCHLLSDIKIDDNIDDIVIY